MKTKRILFSGRVQGVGFRWTTQGIAKNYDVTGYVKNLSDGRVELIAQGQIGVVNEFIDAVRQKMLQNIEDCEEAELPEAETYARFEIRR